MLLLDIREWTVNLSEQSLIWSVEISLKLFSVNFVQPICTWYTLCEGCTNHIPYEKVIAYQDQKKLTEHIGVIVHRQFVANRVGQFILQIR